MPASLRLPLEEWLRTRADDDALRWLFGAMLATTAAVLALDYAALSAPGSEPGAGGPAVTAEPLPSVRTGTEKEPVAPARRVAGKPAGRMTFDLLDNGRLAAVGTIEPGTAKEFEAEIAKRGSYVKAVVLDSPGGSVSDALQMGRLIRAKRYATEVESGRYCASSCPLVFAGGVERRAAAKAAIGVHQVFAASGSGARNGDGMEGAQRVSAECQRYLRDMGVDAQVWVHAMETPKERLYYFKPDELLSLKLATPPGGATARVEARQGS